MTCDDGCVLEDDHDECWTAQDFRDEAALVRAEELADELGGWRRLRHG